MCGPQDLNNTVARGTHGGSGGSGKGEESQQVKEKTKMAKGEKSVKDKKQIQTSPVPVRKNGRDEEKRESRIKTYSPFAFKFYMEQHIENVMKIHQQKLNRRLQLEQEMSKVRCAFTVKFKLKMPSKCLKHPLAVHSVKILYMPYTLFNLFECLSSIMPSKKNSL